MLKASRGGLIAMLALALGLAAACNRYETEKGNKLVDAANVSVKDANSKLESVPGRVEQLDEAVDKVEDEEGLAKLRTEAKAMIADLEKARDSYTDGGNKFTEASKLKVPDKMKEYWETKGQELKKRGEMSAALAGVPQALIDSSNRDAYRQQSRQAFTKFQSLQQEANDLDAKANKIYEENKALFRKE